MTGSARVLVTGGAGFIGSHIVAQLLHDGHRVRILDDLSTGRRDNLAINPGAEFIEGDIRSVETCRRAVEGCEVIFHLAALASVSRSMQEPLPTHEVNVDGTVNLLEAARAAGTRRLVFSSSSSVYGETPILPKRENAEPLPKSPYAASKISGEQYVLAYARGGMLEGVALRYFNVFGPRQDPNGPYAAVIPLLLSAAKRDTSMTIFGDGLQTRDFTFVSNVVFANLQAGFLPAERCSGQVVNVGAGDRTSLLDLVEMTRRVTGRRIPLTHLGERPGDVRHSLADLERATSVLDYRATTGVEEGMKATWEWFRDAAHT